MTKGVRLVHEEILRALGRLGIQSYDPVGEVFDPHKHEAISQMPVEGAEPGTVAQLWQRGYLLGDEVLRAAKVVVAA
jgi:molecular chaperone GrpE